MLKEELKIVFMGTPEFAKVSLQKLLDEKYNVVGVFCQPDKPSGRGMKLKEPEVKVLAKEYGIEVYQPVRLKENEEVKEMLNKLNPDLIVVVAYGKILPKYILDFPKYGCINVHGSILPKYRGAAPIQWAIINGEKTTGITTMYMDQGMDTGDMIDKAELDIEDEDTYGTLHDKLAILGSDLLDKTLKSLLDEAITREKQPEEFTLAPMLDRENTKIDFNKKAEDIVNLVRGTNPFPTSFCNMNGDILKIYKAHKVDIENEEEYSSCKIGEVIQINAKRNEIIVKLKDGFLSIDELKAPGAKQMSSGDFARGNKIKIGDILS